MFYTYNVLDSNSHWKDKQSFYDYSMSLSPSCDIIKFNRIVAFVENNNFDRAIKELSILLEEEPKAWDVYLEIGNIYFLKKDFNKALENYYKVLQIKPDSDLAYLNIGLTQIAMKEDQKAIDNLVKTLEINPNLWQ
jgi:tetratricopeptide (TPR) repeat protein